MNGTKHEAHLSSRPADSLNTLILKEVLSDNQTLDRIHAITPSAECGPASGRPAGVPAFVVSGLVSGLDES